MRKHLSTKRRVKRPTKAAPQDLKGRAKAFVLSFHPNNFRAYWLNRAGAIRAARIFGTGFGLLFLVVLYYAKDLPSPNKINARLTAQTTRFYDRKGETVLYEVYGDKNRTIVDFNKINDHAKKATIAIEDKDFYKHGAFSSVGIIRATFINVVSRGKVQGGSTITQQYVKNALLTNERTFSRKFKELILSVIIEQFYKKDDILKLYLNEIPYGGTAYGIEAACRTYFAYHGPKDCAAQLTLDEASLLAAMAQAPTRYSPYGPNRDTLLVPRQHKVLDLMAQQGYIKKEEAEEAKKVKVFAKMPDRPAYFANIIAPHFVLHLQEQLEAKYGTKAVTENGYKVITTIDLDKQKAAEEAIAKNMPNVKKAGGSNSAMVASDPKTGQIWAMVGSHNFSESQVNVAVSHRQPGSSFKPIVYATAWGPDKNFGPGTTVYDVVTDFGGGYKPLNYSRTTYGVQSMRTALAGSLNIPAVKALYLAGLDKAIEQARKMGIESLDPKADYGLSLTLGAGDVKLTEMVNAYESFANGGVHHKSTGILKVTDGRGRIVEEYKAPKDPPRVLDPQVAYLMSNVLSDNAARSYIFGNLLTIPGREVAVKTGTTESYRDAWTMGYTPNMVVGVWSGNNDNTPMNQGGVSVSAPAWRDFMTKTLPTMANEKFERPKGIKEVTLDADTGKLPTDGTKKTRTDIFPSWYKPTPSTSAKSADIDKVSGKLATSCTPDLAKEKAYSSEIHAEIPPNDPAFGRWEPPVQALAASLGYKPGGNLPTENDDAHRCDDLKPKVDLSVSSLGGGNYRIRAEVTNGEPRFPANKLEIKLNTQIISTQTISGSTNYEFEYAVATNGTHTFRAIVTDAGYYQGEDSQTVNVTGAGGTAFKNLAPTNGSSVPTGTVSFSWNGHPDADRYKLVVKQGAITIHSLGPSPGTSRNAVLTPGVYTWFVEAYDGSNLEGITSTYNLTVQ
jgi:membrane peptidoglycan carboxypeptidase